MAASIAYKCKCGKKYHIYMPMARMTKQLPSMNETNMEKAKEVDKENIASGEIGVIKKYGLWVEANLGEPFVDGSIVENYQCKCGAIIDLDNILKRQMDNTPDSSEGCVLSVTDVSSMQRRSDVG